MELIGTFPEDEYSKAQVFIDRYASEVDSEGIPWVHMEDGQTLSLPDTRISIALFGSAENADQASSNEFDKVLGESRIDIDHDPSFLTTVENTFGIVQIYSKGVFIEIQSQSWDFLLPGDEVIIFGEKHMAFIKYTGEELVKDIQRIPEDKTINEIKTGLLRTRYQKLSNWYRFPFSMN